MILFPDFTETAAFTQKRLPHISAAIFSEFVICYPEKGTEFLFHSA